MLHLFIVSLPVDKQFIDDVDKEFETFGLTGSEEENLFLRKLEVASPNIGDPYSFIDRFGFKLPTSAMSTGCKAAICVLHSPEKIINLTECGRNARGMILAWCKHGFVYLPKCEIDFMDYSNSEVSIQVDGYRFSTISRLNHYLCCERPFAADLAMGDVVCV